MKQILDVWIPRSAGTSIWAALCQNLPEADRQRCVGNARPWKPGVRITTFQHDSLQRVFAAHPQIAQRRSDYFIFAFVRNTWARLLSIHSFLTQEQNKTGKSAFDEAVAASGKTFNEFIKRATSGLVPSLHDEMYPVYQFPCRQLDWLMVDGILVPDFIGRVESVAKDWRTLRGLIGVGGKLSHRNRSSHRDYRTYYTDQMRDAVGKYYAEEIARFHFTF